jgi:hypothetical protein
MAIIESISRFIKRTSDILFPGRNGAYILIGTDRKDLVNSGYGVGGKNEKACATIDIVAGHKGENPDYVNDSSRIYISQKTDADDYFEITKGEKIKGKPTIVASSDNVYLKARSGIKILNKNFSIVVSEDGTVTIESVASSKIKSGAGVIEMLPSGDITIGAETGAARRVLTEQDVCVGIDPTTGIPIKSTFASSIGIDNPLGGKVNNLKIKIR